MQRSAALPPESLRRAGTHRLRRHATCRRLVPDVRAGTSPARDPCTRCVSASSYCGSFRYRQESIGYPASTRGRSAEVPGRSRSASPSHSTSQWTENRKTSRSRSRSLRSRCAPSCPAQRSYRRRECRSRYLNRHRCRRRSSRLPGAEPHRPWPRWKGRCEQRSALGTSSPA